MTSPVETFPILEIVSSKPIAQQFPQRSEETSLVQPQSDKEDSALSKASWQPHRSSHVRWDDYRANGAPASRHRSRKSISEVIETIRTRQASVGANAHEIADALKAPISYKLVTLSVVWYLTSALTNTSSKSILNAFPQPITLTIIQFAFVSLWCLTLAWLAHLFPSLRTNIPALRNGIRYPSVEVIKTTLPLAIFQLLGHILSSTATSQIPVSLVHTIKGLSPLFTVLAYRVFFRIQYAKATYLSLIPLTGGVMMACSTGFSTNLFGILCALSAALVFVTQNIFSKKLFNEAARVEADGATARSRKLDKLNLLCYCSGLAFLLTAPIWLLTEGFPIVIDIFHDGVLGLSGKEDALDHGELMLEFLFNGVFHFLQNILAFVLLSMVSPVSYSVASLIKRVFVIVVAIVWFGNKTTPLQALGISFTFFGLYLYDRTSHEDVADRRANADHFRSQDPLLPIINATKAMEPSLQHPSSNRASSMSFSDKKEDDEPGYVRYGPSPAGALPPGTKQESTWGPGDKARTAYL